MALFALADLHFGRGINKTMDIFGEPWINHMCKTIKNWVNIIDNSDTVLIPGDICWAKKLSDAKPDLDLINELPGKKVLLMGNHDYWWDSQNKVTTAYPSMFFLKNNFYIYNDTAVCGTRGWICPNEIKFDESDKKVYKRECMRLKLSLDMAVNSGYGDKIVVMLHYPPMNDKHEASGFTELISQYRGIRKVVYGHLHGQESIVQRFEGMLNGVEYQLVSADFVNFKPIKIMD